MSTNFATAEQVLPHTRISRQPPPLFSAVSQSKPAAGLVSGRIPASKSLVTEGVIRTLNIGAFHATQRLPQTQVRRKE